MAEDGGVHTSSDEDTHDRNNVGDALDWHSRTGGAEVLQQFLQLGQWSVIGAELR